MRLEVLLEVVAAELGSGSKDTASILSQCDYFFPHFIKLMGFWA